MLDGIRANAQSWGVKLAFGIIIVVFVFWGIGGRSSPRGIVATVNDRNITELEFRQAYAQMEQNIRNSIPGATPELLQSLGLEQNTLQSLVMRKLLEAEAERLGVEISPYELRRVVESMPYFLDKDGGFSADLYLTTLQNSGQSAAQFEDNLRRDMLPEKMQALLSAGAYAAPQSVRNIYNYQQERRKINYMLFPAEKHMSLAAPSQQDIEAAYEERARLYAVPPRVRLEYVALDPAQMSDPSGIDDAAVSAAYEARRDSFFVPERVRASHILILVPENASAEEISKAEDSIKAIEERIRGGEDFAAVARESSQDPGSAARGGDLDWFERAQMVPEFADAAFALKPGEMSGPVRSPFGFHLIKAAEHQASATRTLEDVRDELRAALATERAVTGLQDKADALLAAVMGGQGMAEAAGAEGLTVKDSGLVSADDLAQTLRLRASDVQAVMAAPAGEILDSPLPTDAGLLVVRVAESLPAMTRPLDEVRDELAAALTLDKARALAVDEAEQARGEFADGRPGKDLAPEVRESEAFDRQGYVPYLGVSTDLARAVFEVPAADAGKDLWLDRAFPVDDGAVLVSLAEVSAPDEAAWLTEGAMREQQVRSQRAALMFQAYIMELSRRARVRILMPELVQPRAVPQA
ncbi:MAG: SurA N-terminal domain-containing protein [Desulfovibrionaceae bacterium]|nr:SurA N-terminal domain-containing protein [Desulfovibrionaceae bacterium]